MKSLIFFLALALVIFHATGMRQFSQMDTESAIELRSAEELNDDLAEIEVAAEYRDAVLRGRVDSLEAKMRAERLVRDAIPTGKSRLRNEIEIVQERASALIAAMGDGVIELSGTIPSPQLKAQLKEAVGTLGVRVQDSALRVDQKAEPEVWLKGMPDFVKLFLANSDGGRIEAGQAGIRLSGKFEKQEQKDRAMSRAYELLPAARVFDETTVLEPKDASLFVSRVGGVFQIAATLPATAEGGNLLSNLVTWNKNGQVTYSPEIRDAPWIDEAWKGMNGFFGDVPGDAFVRISSNGMEVGGEVLSAGKKKQALAWFQSKEWSSLTLNDSNLKVRAAVPFQLELIAKSGQAQLNGTVGTQEQKRLVVDEIRKTGLKVADNTNMASGIQLPGWWSRFPVLMGHFAREAQEATLKIQDDQIAISGTMKTPGGEQAFRNQLAAIPGLPSAPKLDLKWPALKAPVLAFQRLPGNEIRLTGMVSSPGEVAEIGAAVAESGIKVNNEIVSDPAYAIADWTKGFATWWPKFRQQAPTASFDYDGKTFRFMDPSTTSAQTTEVASLVKGAFGLSVQFLATEMESDLVPSLSLKRGISGLIASGKVGTEEERQAILATLKEAEPAMRVDGRALEVNPAVKTLAWVQKFDTWWKQLRGQVEKASFSVDDRVFRLEGRPISPNAANDLAGWKNEVFGKNLEFDRTKLEVPKPRMPAFTLRRDGKKVILTGDVDEGGREKLILSVVTAAEPKGTEIVSEFEIDPFVTTPKWMADFGSWWPIFAKNVPQANFSFSEGIVSAEGTAVGVGLEKEAEKLLVAVFGSNPKNAISIRPSQQEIPWIKFSSDPEWVRVSGLVSSEAEKKIILDAIAQLPGKKDTSGLKVNPATKNANWLQGVMMYARDLTKDRKTARIEVNDGTALVKSTVADTGQVNRLELAFNKALGPGFKVDRQLTVEVSNPSKLELKKEGNRLLLIGQVPTADDQKMIVDTVKKTDPTALTRVEVEMGATRPKWLSEFSRWWPRYRAEVPEGVFVIEGDKEPQFQGTVANAQTGKTNAGNLLKDVFGARGKFDWKLPTLDRPRLSLKRTDAGVLLEGMVPTDQERAAIETTVKKTEAKVINRIAVKPNVETADWLVKFGDWWPKLRKEVPDATFNLDTEENSTIGGEADEAAQGRIGGLFAGVFGSKIKIPKFEMKRPAPAKSPWLNFQSDRSKIIVTGEVADARAKQQLETALKGFNGKIDTSGLQIGTVKSEPWTGEIGKYVTQLVAAAGPANLQLKDGKAEVSATLKTGSERDQFYNALERSLGNRFQIANGLKIGRTTEMGTTVNLVDLLPQETIFFPKNSSYYSDSERRKIQGFASKITNLNESKITVFLIGHADARGQSDYNQWLSKKRADRVGNALARYGVEARFVQVEAKGETNAAPLKAGESAWSKDRRVDIRVGKTR